ncbi:MAG: hypothetical protein AAF337_03150 [Pseudomonadota bacterium]
MTKVLAMAALFVSALAHPAAAQQDTRVEVEYRCDIEGQEGRLRAELIVLGKAGLVKGPLGGIVGIIGAGDTSVMYGGELTTPNARYSFTGYDDFADFTDLTTLARFRVRFSAVGQDLLMTVNPFTQGPVQYRCSLVSEQVPGQEPPGQQGEPGGTTNTPRPYGPSAAPWSALQR